MRVWLFRAADRRSAQCRAAGAIPATAVWAFKLPVVVSWLGQLHNRILDGQGWRSPCCLCLLGLYVVCLVVEVCELYGLVQEPSLPLPGKIDVHPSS